MQSSGRKKGARHVFIFCCSSGIDFDVFRENLSKDLYLISQMDSDHFVPIWAVACMEDIKALTTDMDLILDVLRGISSALVASFNNIYVVWECSHQVQNVSSPLLTVWCSFRDGASWRNWRESSTKPQSLYYYFERGPRDNTSWGKCGFLDLHTLWVPKLINWTNCLVCKSRYFTVCLQCLVCFGFF